MAKISKTYIPKETEKYMCAKHLAFFKKKLLEWKPGFVEDAIVDTAKKYKETRKIS